MYHAASRHTIKSSTYPGPQNKIKNTVITKTQKTKRRITASCSSYISNSQMILRSYQRPVTAPHFPGTISTVSVCLTLSDCNSISTFDSIETMLLLHYLVIHKYIHCLWQYTRFIFVTPSYTINSGITYLDLIFHEPWAFPILFLPEKFTRICHPLDNSTRHWWQGTR